MIDLEDLKKRIDMTELCEALGLQPKGKVARCPAHNDAGEGRPNLAIYPDNVHCFRCGFSADAVGLVEKAKGLDFLEAVGEGVDGVDKRADDGVDGAGEPGSAADSS